MVGEKKLCFVIMGFGEKVDYSTGKTLNLDKTFMSIIKPAVEASGFECVRGDELLESGLIDKSMYVLLMHADLVVADISTANPNALYELGVRHAVRPYSTVVIKEEEGTIPFDLSHTEIFRYKHLGEDIGVDEAKRAIEELKALVDKVAREPKVDSPLYGYLSGVEPPRLSQEELEKVIGELADKETSVFAIVEKAKSHMKAGDFLAAAEFWKKASTAVPTEDYFVQQRALATYKSEHPSKDLALSDALKIIEILMDGHETNDPETLGLTGAIYKRKWLINKDVESLKRAIEFYGKGFQITSDYYTGENYALCLDFMSAHESDEDEKLFYSLSAKKTRIKIIEYLSEAANVLLEEPDDRYKWMSATLANCHFYLREDEIAQKFEHIFLDLVASEWEAATYFASKKQLMDLL